MSEAEVLTRGQHGVGRITLNRPKALHALNHEMCRAITAALLGWRDDPAVKSVLIDHAGERGFCAGGDIRAIAESGAGDGRAAAEFFADEYRMNALLFGFPKPITAIVDGVVMGGGVGLSEPAEVRIATERTTYAMPETGIGLFPDVGGGWFLPRLPGFAGTWIGLTGARLKAADTVFLGVHTHYLPTDALEAFRAILAADPAHPADVADGLEADPGPAPVEPHLEAIDRLFRFDTVEEITDALAADGSDWATAQLATLRSKSPQALKVTLRHLRAGYGSFEEALAAEHRLSSRIVRTSDFQEGVRAVIVDKDNQPRWSPAAPEAVSDAGLDALFAPAAEGEAWRPLAFAPKAEPS
jgi:enoyl-CoA hydratase